MKSCSGSILNVLISGVAMTTLGFPPYAGNFASISPNVLVTESLPGKTRYGPVIVGLGGVFSLLFHVDAPPGVAVFVKLLVSLPYCIDSIFVLQANIKISNGGETHFQTVKCIDDALYVTYLL